MKKNTVKKTNLKRLLKYLRPYSGRFFIAVICMGAFAGFATSLLVLLKKAIDGIFIDKNLTMLFFASFGVPAVFALKGFADYGRSYLLNYIGQNVIRDLRMQIYEKLIILSHDFYVRNSSAKIMSRVTSDLSVLEMSDRIGRASCRERV